MTRVLDELERIGEKTKANEKKTFTKQEGASTMSKLGKLTKLSPFGKKSTDFSFDDRAAYLLVKGSCQKALGKNEESVELFREVIDMQDVLVEKLYVPYCCYELGESYYMLGKLKEAEEFMKKCSKFGGYDWEDPLKVRLRVTFDQLKKGEKPSIQSPPSLDALANMMEDNKIDDKDMDDKDIDALEQKETNEEFVEEDD